MAEPLSRLVSRMDQLYEYDREPVQPSSLQPARYFAALFAGEHVAATEFVIGALFVSWGAQTRDVVLGLVLGNLLAVLTWTFVCVPIALETRLTLYWYLRRIAGPGTALIYNVLNALLFCILGGCMITVSASAIRMLFGIPPQTAWYPQDPRWVLLVLALGAVVVTLAILGFKRLSQFAEVCAPWMFFMFLAGALALLPGLASQSGVGEVRSLADLWALADKAIWTGVAPPGQQALSFWHIAAFAWVCNLATHAGLSDMALFRYARGISCGWTSAIGMFFGHYLAWISAGIMGAATSLMLHRPMAQLDSGEIAVNALGAAGSICVLLAGWTTSNPTLYRAGLAFQAVTPNWPRWLVTLLAGAATTVIACFPFVFTKLLDFVGWLGLLLMPVGAIVFVEHWVFPRLGWTRYWVEQKGLAFSWPALASWAVAIGVSVLLTSSGVLHLFFVFVPVWLLTVVLYSGLAALAGARSVGPPPQLDSTLPPLAAAPSAADSSPAARPPSPPVSPNRALLWVFGLVALAALLVCLALPVWVFARGTAGYEARLVWFKQLLLWASGVHLAAVTLWAIQKEKNQGEF